MIASLPSSWWRDAPALRFLSLFLAAWVGLRLVSPMMGAPLNGGQADAQGLASRMTAEILRGQSAFEMVLRESAAPSAPMPANPPPAGAALESASPAGPPRQRGLIAAEKPKGPKQNPHVLPRALAMEANMDRRDQQSMGHLAGVPELPRSPHSPAFSRQMAGWSLSAWALVREQDGRQALPVVGELAGSQAGARIAYGFGTNGRLRVYGRATMALAHTRQSEAAVGLTYAPIAALPLDVAVERRMKLGPDGRSAMAVMVVGGVSGKALPAHFRLDAYGQAGVVGLRSRDMFADGAVVIDRAVKRSAERRSLRIGAVVAGAAQPRLSRLDVGPRITLPLPAIGQGARIAVDWRHRIMGRAQPDSGLALTLAADF